MPQTKPRRALTDPDEHPGATVVIWDGKCNFCRTQVERIQAFDRSGKLTYISLHDPRVSERYPELNYDQLMDQMWVITSDHQRFGGADAIRYLSRHLPRLWWLAPVMHLPYAMPLWRYFYRVLANRRYRLAGENCDGGTCSLHAKTQAK
jgi:predicted DCC family thiol-disulfide oxidoreductase YuxK